MFGMILIFFFVWKEFPNLTDAAALQQQQQLAAKPKTTVSQPPHSTAQTLNVNDSAHVHSQEAQSINSNQQLNSGPVLKPSSNFSINLFIYFF